MQMKSIFILFNAIHVKQIIFLSEIIRHFTTAYAIIEFQKLNERNRKLFYNQT